MAIGLALVAGVAGGAPRAARAEDCGAWPKPVLCEAQLLVTADGKTERLKADARVRLAPRGQMTLEVDGRDQRGRRFPEEYLSLGFRANTCGRLLAVDGRGRGDLQVTARGDAGRCRLEVWVPGNLNFSWALDMDVDPAARTTYSRRDAERVVRALYRAVLQRDVDDESLRAAVAEIQQGNLEAFVGSMERSGEFLTQRGHLSHEEMLDAFYEGVFNRPADSLGVKDYLNLVRQGRHADVLLRLIRSAEFEKRLR
ncbi:MAG: DUF4214 domain-containing protein [Gammaproteobacteria bacterium]|nr:DUF4214 domain-containing protein [Gammaproteobacteria bacterium]